MNIKPASTHLTRKPANRWTRHLCSVLATTLIFVSGTSFLSLMEAFH